MSLSSNQVERVGLMAERVDLLGSCIFNTTSPDLTQVVLCTQKGHRMPSLNAVQGVGFKV